MFVVSVRRERRGAKGGDQSHDEASISMTDHTAMLSSLLSSLTSFDIFNYVFHTSIGTCFFFFFPQHSPPPPLLLSYSPPPPPYFHLFFFKWLPPSFLCWSGLFHIWGWGWGGGGQIAQRSHYCPTPKKEDGRVREGKASQGARRRCCQICQGLLLDLPASFERRCQQTLKEVKSSIVPKMRTKVKIGIIESDWCAVLCCDFYHPSTHPSIQ